MKKSFLTSLCALCTLFLVQAADYTIEPGENAASYALPVYMGEQGSASSFYGSITQSIFLASELLDEDENPASEGDVTYITFYYTAKGNTSATGFSRSIEIYLMEIDPSINEYAMVNIPYEHVTYGTTDSYYSYFLCNESNKAGQKVFDGNLITEDVSSGDTKEVKLTLSSSFHWDGNKNIVMTVVDKSATTQPSSNMRFWISSTKVGDVGHPRFAYTFWKNSSDERVNWISDGNYNFSNRLSDYYGSNTRDNRSEDNQKKQRSYVPKTTFTIESSAAPVAPSTPEDLAATPSANSASLSWSAVDGATSYDLYNSTSIDGAYSKFASPTTNTYEWTGLTAETTYYVKVAAVNGAGSSALSGPISFTTLAPHIHDGITFEPWSNPSAMPTSGNYYLANNVALDPYDPTTITLTGNLNLCLNGNTANLYGTKIVVPEDKTLTIYDNVGGGKLTGFVESDVAWLESASSALIVVYSGGTLVLKQGTIENTYEHNSEDPSDGWSYAIYSNGTVRISGGVLINSNDADIYLHESRIITLDAAISNAEKHTVYITGGTFTSGWSTYMSAADPRDYFASANSGKSVCLSEGEAALRTLLNLSENSNNSSIGTHYNQVVDVNLTRSLTSAQYNTFCLPFALTNAQMAEFFGAGYDLEELTSSSLEEEILTLTFTQVTALEAGKPYLLQPSIEVVNPSFEGVTIMANMPDTIETTYADLRAIYRPTELAGDNHNLLFLGEDNTLFWPESTGNMKAFRAYFVVKGAAANAVQARIGRAESQTTAIDNQKSHIDNHKYMKDGQLLIERNGVIYNTQGQTIK